MFHTIISSILLIPLFLAAPSSSFASTDSKEVEGEITPNQLYEYKWVVTSTSVVSNSFGSWRVGPTGHSPGTLSVNESTTLNRSYTNTISGNYSIGKSAIGSSLGVTIGKSQTHGTSYTISLSTGQTKTIIVRPKIKRYKVISTYYRYPVGTTGSRKAIKTETAYVNTFNGWDYNWRYGY
ncbi:hypothetical protein [Virgibacillus senegalensis]|uniref:hypothetical protein n=1 Tax=Virgibacillus senegalensis TaxID=1499679 RepID=UPI00069D1A9D|nr:hypothetical protein [Virgibacillus senegalensis]